VGALLKSSVCTEWCECHAAGACIIADAVSDTAVLCSDVSPGGQTVSAIVGVGVRLALDKVQWLANAVGMSLSLLAMQLTQTTHPPGGATALIACSMAQLPPW
jgi:CBS-domain-containing membrane protein